MIIDKPCFYCGNKLCKPVLFGVGIDRIDSSLSYSEYNSVSCCVLCNTIKNDLLSKEEMLKVAKLLINERVNIDPIDVNEYRQKHNSDSVISQVPVALTTNVCCDCGKVISSMAKRCRSCAHKK